MKFDEIEERLVRSLRHLFDRKKILFMVPVVVTCGVVAWFCRALVLSASSWVSLSLTFLPLFFASAILFGAGVVLARVYHKEVRGERFSYRKIVRSTVPLLFQVGYFWVPVVLGYLVLWGLLGLFYLAHSTAKCDKQIKIESGQMMAATSMVFFRPKHHLGGAYAQRLPSSDQRPKMPVERFK